MSTVGTSWRAQLGHPPVGLGLRPDVPIKSGTTTTTTTIAMGDNDDDCQDVRDHGDDDGDGEDDGAYPRKTAHRHPCGAGGLGRSYHMSLRRREETIQQVGKAIGANRERRRRHATLCLGRVGWSPCRHSASRCAGGRRGFLVAVSRSIADQCACAGGGQTALALARGAPIVQSGPGSALWFCGGVARSSGHLEAIPSPHSAVGRRALCKSRSLRSAISSLPPRCGGLAHYTTASKHYERLTWFVMRARMQSLVADQFRVGALLSSAACTWRQAVLPAPKANKSSCARSPFPFHPFYAWHRRRKNKTHDVSQTRAPAHALFGCRKVVLRSMRRSVA